LLYAVVSVSLYALVCWISVLLLYSITTFQSISVLRRIQAALEASADFSSIVLTQWPAFCWLQHNMKCAVLKHADLI
jgi:hypothetical protein